MPVRVCAHTEWEVEAGAGGRGCAPWEGPDPQSCSATLQLVTERRQVCRPLESLSFPTCLSNSCDDFAREAVLRSIAGPLNGGFGSGEWDLEGNWNFFLSFFF